MATTDDTGEGGEYKDDDGRTIKKRLGMTEFRNITDAKNNFKKYARLNGIEKYSIKE